MLLRPSLKLDLMQINLNLCFLSTCLHHLLLRPAKAVAVADPRLLDCQNNDADSWSSFTGFFSPSTHTLVSSVPPIFLCSSGHLCTTPYQLDFHTLVKPVAQSCCTTSSNWLRGSSKDTNYHFHVELERPRKRNFM